MPRLIPDLEAHFVKYVDEIDTWNVAIGPSETWRERGCPSRSVTGPRVHVYTVDTLAEAQGVWLLCPLCWMNWKHGKARSPHSIDVTFADKGVLDHHGSHDSEGKPSRWEVSGTSLENLTTRPSIFLKGAGCGWHGYITDGIAT